MTSAPSRSVLSVDAVHRLVDQWRAALARRAPVEELLPHLANGLLVELPGRIVRGAQDFRHWYGESGGQAALCDDRPGADEVRVRVVSPVHAQVTLQDPGSSPDAPAPLARQTWWVVLQDGVPRIRTMAFHQPAPQPA
ncbi:MULTISPECIES: hypothetical protein [Streptomyces]|uniref:SnoaL-like domain-containing protein n=2 Tax=Streptomyces TaxID=1883 RepID=A0ABQ3R884_STRRR|nr:hypothetical protein [Streptomyces rubradiris]GHH22878.1 hypothetical protein GCM10018792_58840 [Streptomyces rubradiris]GHI52064.1 hypothetical protein Srubr_19100 [Streptomyces rubradiris]